VVAVISESEPVLAPMFIADNEGRYIQLVIKLPQQQALINKLNLVRTWLFDNPIGNVHVKFSIRIDYEKQEVTILYHFGPMGMGGF